MAHTHEVKIILRFENDYHQHGAYFVGVVELLKGPISPNGHFGRLNNENTWYECVTVEVGTNYSLDDWRHKWRHTQTNIRRNIS